MIGSQFVGRGATAGVIGVLCVVVSGVGIAAAANGGSLTLGHSNRATKTTSLKDSKGTPLSLVGKKSKPPLKVNSSKLVAHLNASLVGGKSAAALSSNAITYAAGSANDTFTSATAYSIGISKGLYDISLQAVLDPSDGSTSAPVQTQCAVVSKNVQTVYAASSAVYIGGGFPLLSADNVATVPSGGVLLFCSSSGTDPTTIEAPITVSFIKINSQTRRTAPLGSLPVARPERLR